MGEPVLRLVDPEFEPRQDARPGSPDPNRLPDPDPTPVVPADGTRTDPESDSLPDRQADRDPDSGTGPDRSGTAGRPGAGRDRAAAATARKAAVAVTRLGSHWAAMIHDDATRPGGLWQGMYRGTPDSIADLHVYAVSRHWVPKGHDGKLLPAVGALYTHTVAKGGAALGFSIAWVTGRFFRLVVFLAVVGIVMTLVLSFS